MVIEAVARLLPEVMGNEASAGEESFADGLVEYPQYTRPASFRGFEVPEILRSGDHARIARWRHAEALRRTRDRRPDLLERRGLSDAERAVLEDGRDGVVRLRCSPPFAVCSFLGRSLTMQRTDLVDRASLRDDIPDFGPGDTLKVHVRVVEGNRERVQIFQGVVIRRQGSGLRETFTVRKVSFGVGVERTFPVHSPIIARIEVLTRGDVRRAKLYYLRGRVGKAAKVKEKRF